MPEEKVVTQQQEHLEAVIGWATKLQASLQPLLDAHGDRVHFRPTSQGITLVGLLYERPQRGIGGLRNLDSVAADFEVLFAQHRRDVPQGRPTCEKELQSFLLREAYTHSRRMVSLMLKWLQGYVLGDKGNLSSKLASDLRRHGHRLLTPLRSNMKPDGRTDEEVALLKKRGIVESVLNLLKNVLRVAHTKHRSSGELRLAPVGGSK